MYSLLHNIQASILDMMRQDLATTMSEPRLVARFDIPGGGGGGLVVLW